MAKYFGTDGFRGEANKTLTAEHAYKIGRSLGQYYDREHDGREEGDREQGDRKQVDREHKTCRVIIGKDTRRSSYMFEYVLTAGLMASGTNAYLLHTATTPSVSYVARTEGSDYGVIISASHNPYHDNGIKLINAQGEKMDKGMILQVEIYLDGISGEIPLAVRERIGRTIDHATGRSRYTSYLISLAIRSYKNVKVGLDYTSKSAWMIAKSVFDAPGTFTYVINNEPDGSNINTSCGFTYMEDPVRSMKEKKLDVGFAFDGDAGRCLCVDEKGNLVDGDLVFYIYGRYMKEQGKLAGNKIVTTVMPNFGLYRALGEAGIEYERTAVGDKYACEDVALDSYRTGGEQSGHIIFRKHAATGNGILIIIKIMGMILEKKRLFSRLTGPAHIYSQVFENIRVKDKQTAREGRDVQDTVNRVEQELETKGRILVRESGMELVMRVMVEARDGHKCREYVDRIIRVVVDKGHRDVLPQGEKRRTENAGNRGYFYTDL